MIWDAISAVGTILAAIVGVVGIWLNLWDKTKKLKINFETVPSFKIYLSNNSLRTIVITKMICSVKTHIFYVEYFEGLKEVTLPPATLQSIDIIKQDIFNAYHKNKTCAFCVPSEKIKFILYDNYGRKYIKKTDVSICAFEE